MTEFRFITMIWLIFAISNYWSIVWIELLRILIESSFSGKTVADLDPSFIIFSENVNVKERKRKRTNNCIGELFKDEPLRQMHDQDFYDVSLMIAGKANVIYKVGYYVLICYWELEQTEKILSAQKLLLKNWKLKLLRILTLFFVFKFINFPWSFNFISAFMKMK